MKHLIPVSEEMALSSDDFHYWLIQKPGKWITCHHRAMRSRIVETTSNSVKTYYRVWHDSRIYDENNIYKTQEEAQNECDRRNI